MCVCVCVCARENEGECEMGKQDRYRALGAESGRVCRCVSDRKQLIKMYHDDPQNIFLENRKKRRCKRI